MPGKFRHECYTTTVLNRINVFLADPDKKSKNKCCIIDIYNKQKKKQWYMLIFVVSVKSLFPSTGSSAFAYTSCLRSRTRQCCDLSEEGQTCGLIILVGVRAHRSLWRRGNSSSFSYMLEAWKEQRFGYTCSSWRRSIEDETSFLTQSRVLCS